MWRVRTFDVWGNAEDGWEINDSFAANNLINMPKNASDLKI